MKVIQLHLFFIPISNPNCTRKISPVFAFSSRLLKQEISASGAEIPREPFHQGDLPTGMRNLKENHFGTAQLLMKPLDCSFQGFAWNKQVPDLKAQLCRKADNKIQQTLI